jgi:Zn-dependent M16 (insulinase) family peptidase
MRTCFVVALVLGACSSPARAPAVVTPGSGSGSASPAPVVAPPVAFSLETLAPGVSVHGFTPTAVYLDGADKPIGARLVHDRSKFTFDYLRIESAPQGFIWVNSFPTSDKGEPHTQEHLLLGKGDRGRKMASFQAMALAESSAFTEQWRTAYHFHTVAAKETFWPVFADQLGALLDPDYTDEEIRREVRNFGVDKAADGTLRLEEKGTVYNEMVRTYESADAGLYRAALQTVYGPAHPLAYESGGYPEAIRTMTPADIRKFHADNYHLANMGMVGAFPSSMALADVLDHTAAVLDGSTQRAGRVITERELPPPTAAPAGTVTIAEYPYSDTTTPSPVMLVWPATRDLPLADRTLLGLFLDAFAGDESTTLYKKLIDSKTRTIDLGASGVSAFVSDDQGEPIFLSLAGVRADQLDPATLAKVRADILAELARIAQLPDGDPELVAFDRRVQSRVIDQRRRLGKFLDSPPGFGFRGTGSDWISQLHRLERAPGFSKSLTLRPELATIDALLAGGGNPWRDRIKAWGLLDAPYGLIARPSPKLRAAIDADRAARIQAEQARLIAQYAAKDAATALARYQVDYDAQSKLLEAAAQAAQLPPLVATPPMTLDDELRYTTAPVGQVPALRATFDSMQSSRVSVAFKLDGIADDDMMYLADLPALMSEVGLVDGAGKGQPSDEVREQQRKEILALDIYYTEDLRTRRSELVIAGAGNDAAETRRAIAWMARVRTQADWRVANLPRLRDVVDQAATNLRQAMQGAEEGWVRDPHDAWANEDWALHLHTQSFLTRAHDLHRLRWQLLDPLDPKVTAEVTGFLTTLRGAARLPRAQLVLLAAALADPAKAPGPAGARYAGAAKHLSPAAARLAVEAGKDLTLLLPDLPEGSLAHDWTYLCGQMAADLGVGAPAALAKLAAVRDAIVDPAANARFVIVGSPASQQTIDADVVALAGALVGGAPPAPTHAAHRYISERLRDHDPGKAAPAFVGLFAPATSSGVFINSAPATALTATDDAQLLDYLASNLYTGHGAHSLFMKTWAAGLAYSNGVHPLVHQGAIEYYAERCPLLPQTLGFVIDQLKHVTPDPNIARYAIATAFDSRIAGAYETRAAAMAADLVDGLTPEVVRGFRQRLLAQVDRPDLAADLFRRMPAVYARVMPGFGAPGAGAINFVIGPAKQLDAYQAYLRAAVGKGTVLHRLYPRDFWIPARI